MIRAVVIDDEPLALNVIENFCSSSSDVNLLKSFTNPKEGVKYINQFPVDLVFLDIQMPSVLGTDVAKLIRQDVLIVFTTAYDNFAVEGFDLNAVDYLLKPVSRQRFEQAIDKVKKYLTGLQGASKTTEPYVTIRADYSLVKVEVSRIRYIEGLDDYIKIHLDDSKTIVARLTMKGMLELLPQGKFIRVHRSYIVPINKITALKNKILFLDQFQIPIGSSFEKNIEGLF